MAKKNVKSEEPKKKKPISLNILEIAKRLQKLEETGGGTPYTLPTASADTKGGVKIGSGLSMTGEVLSADSYTLPTAAADTKGGVMIGDGLTMTGEVLSVDAVGASDVSYGTGTVKDALDGLTANTLGTAVDISEYVENNKYTFPSDGYVALESTSTSGYVVVYINDMRTIARNEKSDFIMVYVRKGMDFYKSTSYSGTYTCKFYPLV